MPHVHRRGHRTRPTPRPRPIPLFVWRPLRAPRKAPPSPNPPSVPLLHSSHAHAPLVATSPTAKFPPAGSRQCNILTVFTLCRYAAERGWPLVQTQCASLPVHSLRRRGVARRAQRSQPAAEGGGGADRRRQRAACRAAPTRGAGPVSQSRTTRRPRRARRRAQSRGARRGTRRSRPPRRCCRRRRRAAACRRSPRPPQEAATRATAGGLEGDAACFVERRQRPAPAPARAPAAGPLRTARSAPPRAPCCPHATRTHKHTRACVAKSSLPPSCSKPTTRSTLRPCLKNTTQGSTLMPSLTVKKGASWGGGRG